MRITESAVISNLIQNINKAREKLNTAQLKVATGRKVNTASDDPYQTNSILNLKNMISRNEQFSKNVEDALDFLTATSNAVDNFINSLMEIKSLLVEVSNSAREPDYKTYAQRLGHLFSQLLDAVNTKFRGKYIFNGTKTNVKPFEYNERTGVLIADLSDGEIKFEISDGIFEKVNLTVNELFGGREIFDVVLQIKNSLESGVRPNSAVLERFKQLFDEIVSKSSDAGALFNRFLLIQKQIEKQNSILREILSVKWDTDMAETAVEIQKNQIILELAYAIAGKILQKTIIEYLR